MGMSIDVTNLEIVKTFSGFLQIMQEPDKYKDLLKETDRLIQEQKKVLGVVQTKEQADEYIAKAEATVAKWAAADEKKQADFDVLVVKTKSDWDTKNSKLQELLKEAEEQKQEAESLRRQASDNAASAAKDKTQASEAAKALDLKMVDLQQKEAALDEKLKTVKQMLGE